MNYDFGYLACTGIVQWHAVGFHTSEYLWSLGQHCKEERHLRWWHGFWTRNWQDSCQILHTAVTSQTNLSNFNILNYLRFLGDWPSPPLSPRTTPTGIVKYDKIILFNFASAAVFWVDRLPRFFSPPRLLLLVQASSGFSQTTFIWWIVAGNMQDIFFYNLFEGWVGLE